MAPTTTLIYAGILGLMLIALSVPVIRQRYRARVSLGPGTDAELLRRIRIQGNFTEYVPLALILIWLLDAAQFSVWVIHVLGITLVVARLCHAFGLRPAPTLHPGRPIGVVGTFLVIGVASILGLLWALAGIRL
jgi:uncharacterized membrane protein YecN with MAPEG domain